MPHNVYCSNSKTANYSSFEQPHLQVPVDESKNERRLAAPWHEGSTDSREIKVGRSKKHY
eukprot:scaffold11639_cov172-Amphora_coffeaeformis.AAC.6